MSNPNKVSKKIFDDLIAEYVVDNTSTEKQNIVAAPSNTSKKVTKSATKSSKKLGSSDAVRDDFRDDFHGAAQPIHNINVYLKSILDRI
jgi:hypothetical protein